MLKNYQGEIIESLKYSILFGPVAVTLTLLIEEYKPSAIFILVDTNTSTYCLPQLLQNIPRLKHALILEIKEGEQHKNISTTTLIWEFLMKYKADRSSLLLNVGGGVLTDMGAFAASTFKRGISFIQIPTTLLSQVDASVGGKTGIDFHGEKNMIGTFTQPKAVLIDSVFLKTLMPKELVSGAAELIKHGLISDAVFFESLANSSSNWLKTEFPAWVIQKSIALKNQVVLKDPFEKNIRKILNFGHTIGHALETWSLKHDENPLRHGEAIGIGMICEAYLSMLKAGLSVVELERINSFLFSLYGSKSIEAANFHTLYDLMKNDKKNELGQINFSLLKKTGLAWINYSCSQEEIFAALKFYNKNFVF